MKDTTRIIHERAKTLAQDYLHTEGKLLSILMEMRRQRLFDELDYSGIFDYCEHALNFSRAQSYYFKTVAEASEKVPELKSAIAQGELTLSEARRIAPVITKENSSHWIDQAKNLSQTELEKAVTEANPKARPKDRIRPVAKNISELKVSMDEKTEENLSVLKELLSQKLKKTATLADVIAWATQVTRDKFDPVKKAERSKISSGNPKVQLPGRHPLPAHVRHEVIRREGMRCSHKTEDGRRCTEKRWLHFHHLIAVSKGGLNTSDNLQLLCSRHHKLQHEPRL